MAAARWRGLEVMKFLIDKGATRMLKEKTVLRRSMEAAKWGISKS